MDLHKIIVGIYVISWIITWIWYWKKITDLRDCDEVYLQDL